MKRNSRHHDIFPISLREITVSRVVDITPGMRRITFTSDEFDAHQQGDVQVPEMISTGFDDDVRLIFPHPETGERPAPRALGDGRLEWTAEINELFRTYTVRRWDAGTGEVDIDFARHGSGLAESWSESAAPGDSIYMAGPKNCGALPEGVDCLLLAGDETALPAIGRCVESYPSLKAVAVIEVTTPDRIQKLNISSPDVELHWVVRSQGQSLGSALESLDWPEGTPYVWCAGEAGQLRGIRKLVKERGVKPENTQIVGYWRDGNASTSKATSTIAAYNRLAEMADIAPAFAVRAGAEAGIFAAIDAGLTTPEPLAEKTGIASDRLVRFMRYLAALELVTIEHEESPSSDQPSDGAVTYGLTPVGMELADPTSPAGGYLSGFGSMPAMSFIHVGRGLRTGNPVQLGTSGRTMSEWQDAKPELDSHMAVGANLRMSWVAPAVVAGLDLGGASSALTLGPGAAVLADELTRTNPSLSVTIVDRPEHEELNMAEVNDSRRSRVSHVHASDPASVPSDQFDIPRADVAVVHDPWGGAVAGMDSNMGSGSPDSSSDGSVSGAGVIAHLSDTVSLIVIVTQVLADDGSGDEEDYEADIQRMLVSGASIPTERDVRVALRDAGFEVESRQPVGWGPIRFVARRVG
ncbi:siderophore-interacting protein [Corynebacterium sp. 23_3061]|uniref:siderophore-interacting protein n=1 Tax=Corynebacterium kroppenstedtii TaxID=161879 RepID=UPI001957C5F5|nr:siderophore-interacting protein [Corynebacterium kroppenstedtii]QRQ65772.1 siderophore-interacting protein [Corynebacterium kroppenstedtii]